MKSKIKLFLRFTVLIFIFTAFGYFIILHIVHHTPTPVDKKYLVDCKTTGHIHSIIITKDGFEPSTLTAKTCDWIVFKNTDSVYHQPAFGEHDEHLIYPGFVEKPIKSYKSNEGVLRAFGAYEIHDHFYEHFEGKIVIKQ